MSYKYNFTLLVKILFAISKSVSTIECELFPLFRGVAAEPDGVFGCFPHSFTNFSTCLPTRTKYTPAGKLDTSIRKFLL